MRTVQDSAIAEKSLPDIQSNFYVSFKNKPSRKNIRSVFPKERPPKLYVPRTFVCHFGHFTFRLRKLMSFRICFGQVSEEGNIYVGRGWDWANTYANQTLAVTFMGDYGRFHPSAKQLEGVQFLLAHAVANGALEVDYKLVAQNQVTK